MVITVLGPEAFYNIVGFFSKYSGKWKEAILIIGDINQDGWTCELYIRQLSPIVAYSLSLSLSLSSLSLISLPELFHLYLLNHFSPNSFSHCDSWYSNCSTFGQWSSLQLRHSHAPLSINLWMFSCFASCWRVVRLWASVLGAASLHSGPLCRGIMS